SGGIRTDTGVLASKYPRNAKPPLVITNHQLFSGQLPLSSVQSNKGCSLWQLLDDQMVIGNTISIKRVKWLSQIVKDKIRNIHNIVDGFYSQRLKIVLEPIGRRCHLDTRDS